MAGRKTIHETPFHRLAGKIARTPVAQRKTAVLGWLAGQGNDRAYLLGRESDPARRNAAHHANGPPPSREHRRRKAIAPAKRSPSCAKSPACPPFPQSQGLHPKAIRCEPASQAVCGVKDARIRRSSPSRSSSLNSILAALRPISSLHREIIATENQTTENKSLICVSELTPTCTSRSLYSRDPMARQAFIFNA